MVRERESECERGRDRRKVGGKEREGEMEGGKEGEIERKNKNLEIRLFLGPEQ